MPTADEGLDRFWAQLAKPVEKQAEEKSSAAPVQQMLVGSAGRDVIIMGDVPRKAFEIFFEQRNSRSKS